MKENPDFHCDSLDDFIADHPEFEDIAEDYIGLDDFLEDYPEFTSLIETGEYPDSFDDAHEEDTFDDWDTLSDMLDDFPELDYLDDVSGMDEGDWYES